MPVGDGIGVFPVSNNVFKISINGRNSAPDMRVVKELTTFSPNIDSGTEEWTPMDAGGWARKAVTSKSLTFSFSGKRYYGDPGNDYVAGLLIGIGQEVESIFEWEMPNGDKLEMDCIINLTTPSGGDATEIDNLEFELTSDGLPVFTPYSGGLETLTFICSAGSVSGTQIEAVVPVLTGVNSYRYKINGTLPALDENLTGKGWAPYTLGSDIDVVAGNSIALVEVTAALLAKKGGIAPAVT